jgi:hypothetical protein
MNHIAFFGASVTQQKNGYTYEFKKLVNDDSLNIGVFGYGSMHLYDAGVCFIDNVINSKPRFCFIDWFSTGFINYNITQYLDAIVYKLNSIDCKIIFLLFDRIDMNDKRIEMYNIAKQYAVNHNIDMIEMYNLVNTKEYLRDMVHTNELGAKYYAEKIYNHYIGMNYNDYIKVDVKENYLCNIKSIEYNEPVTIHNKLTIRGKGTVIGIYQLLGPHSPKHVIVNNNMIPVYDQWCHFERESIKIKFRFENDTDIIISEEDNQNNKYLKILKIFYIGNVET